jgi:hypothetical protein
MRDWRLTSSGHSPRRCFGKGLLAGVLAVTAGLGTAVGKKEENLNRDARIDLIRGLSSEIVVAKVELPRGRKGIFVNSKGEVNKERAEAELKVNGVAIRPGMPVEITKITFKPDRIVFEINKGGKRGRKWYQHIEVGMGNVMTPIAPDDTPVLAYGSWISLTFSDKVPELTVAQAKQMLASVLDFNRHSPTVLYSPAVPPEFKEAIKNHQVLVGMNRDAVLSSKGPPDRKIREMRDGSEQEDWLYGLPPHVLFVTFDGDTVVKVHQD